MQLSVFQERRQVDSLEDLHAALLHRHQGQFGAFWLSTTRCPSIGLFINHESACLFFIREEGDPGFHSLGVQSDNFEDETEFLIDNYQCDLYPQAMIVPAAAGIAAVEEFFETGKLPKKVK
ncbi:MAG: hypothetical protein KDA66_02745, partial [Planctomycetaceae bacterium]|nr:hypothetical protein [Planctomycetaceae bacterium]